MGPWFGDGGLNRRVAEAAEPDGTHGSEAEGCTAESLSSQSRMGPWFGGGGGLSRETQCEERRREGRTTRESVPSRCSGNSASLRFNIRTKIRPLPLCDLSVSAVQPLRT